MKNTFKLIQMKDGSFAEVDDCDYSAVIAFKWWSSKRGKTCYAETKIEKKTVLMHRLILGCVKGQEVDHIDGNALNNKRSNLRICSRAENQKNRGKFKNNKSGYCGVYFSSGRKKPWIAEINSDLKRYRLGSFDTAYNAAIAYNNAAIRLHGEYAKINQVITQL